MEDIESGRNISSPLAAKEIDFSKYIDEVNEDSGRARKLVTILLISTVLVFIAWINSLEDNYNWLKSRIVTEENAYAFLIFPEESSDSIILPNGNVIVNRFNWSSFQDSLQSFYHLKDDDVKHKCEIQNFELKLPFFLLEECSAANCHDSVRKSISDKSKTKYYKLYSSISNAQFERVQQVLRALKLRNFTSRFEVNRKIMGLQSDILETTQQIRVPIIGLSFDVNLLCIFSGLFFSVIYFLLFHARARERKNLTLVFELSGKPEINYNKIRLYQFLTMQQVLTIPPSIDEFLKNEGYSQNDIGKIIPKSRFKKLRVLLPVLAPLLMWFICFGYDIFTSFYGFSVNSLMTYLHFGFAILVGFICRYGYKKCYEEWATIEILWEKEAVRAVCQYRNWPIPKEFT